MTLETTMGQGVVPTMARADQWDPDGCRTQSELNARYSPPLHLFQHFGGSLQPNLVDNELCQSTTDRMVSHYDDAPLLICKWELFKFSVQFNAIMLLAPKELL